MHILKAKLIVILTLTDLDYQNLYVNIVASLMVTVQYIEVRLYLIVLKVDTGTACIVTYWVTSVKKIVLNCKHPIESKVVFRSFSKNKIPVIGKCLNSCSYDGCKVNIEL